MAEVVKKKRYSFFQNSIARNELKTLPGTKDVVDRRDRKLIFLFLK